MRTNSLQHGSAPGSASQALSGPLPMEVFLVPVGRERYELYCEKADDLPEEGDDRDRHGLFGSLAGRLRRLLAALRDDGPRPRRAPDTWSRRLRARLVRWVAEAIAEQRLLWQLRRQSAALLVYPEDLTEPRAMEIVRATLKRDADRHRLWLGVDGALLLASGVLALVPGPNLLAYYFAFRVVGHYLSRRGARQGLCRVAWRARGSTPLVTLREAIFRSPAERAGLVRDVAARLQLAHLAVFVERTAVPGA